MRRLLALAAIMACCAAATPENPAASAAAPSVEALIGTWRVLLFYSADEAPSQTTLVVTGIVDGVPKGTFYDTPFSAARVIVHEGEVRFSAVTEDNSGPYLHSGALEDGAIEGQTHAVGRDFLMAWEAEKLED